MRISDWSSDVCSSDLYIDLHLVHEVTSPQAFESLRLTGRPVRRPDLTLATVDHNVPTTNRNEPSPGPLSAQQIERSEERRVGTECGSTCRSRRVPDDEKKNTTTKQSTKTYQIT